MTCHTRRDLGLLALRLGTGGVLAAHGAQKLFGWFGGGGIDGTAQGMDAMGYRPARPSAIASGVVEAGGGLLLALGLATPAAGAAAAGGMAGAAAVHAPSGFFAQSGGFEYPGFLGWTAASIGLAGAGRYSLDHATDHCLDRHWMVPVAFAASAAAAVLVIRRRAQGLAAAADEAADGGGTAP
ncbi:DoxX family protein [Streptomyces corynorhini]|uniref:DoxX family protein n=1 Tax=Streptomyces corynorhini TaxID=2282652 RepID=A0A370BI63_9ACTN|nr:DoxX family protein [Streptomyces corynorhini]RDG40009.1 DoxX family protein [Streptomyces corynorhini]